jgi:bifunctional DNA-binding transcriptional regulator/antitoxin component of YhaV-PrlF toxin-antitoxin module
MNKTWTIQVQDNGVLQLPEEVTRDLGWKSGDVLHWRRIEKGAVSVKRCAEISPMDLSLWFDDYYESIAEGEAYVVEVLVCFGRDGLQRAVCRGGYGRLSGDGGYLHLRRQIKRSDRGEANERELGCG